jgi:hypothetical protein
VAAGPEPTLLVLIGPQVQGMLRIRPMPHGHGSMTPSNDPPRTGSDPEDAVLANLAAPDRTAEHAETALH